MKIFNYTLEFAVFVCGAVVMMFELVGSRVLGPYFGTSIFVWTSLIGIVLGSLSLGYYVGGKMADKKPSLNALSLIIFLSAVCLGFIILTKDILLVYLLAAIENVKVSSVIASVVLFLPTSVLLGMVSPYAAKLRLANLNTSGTIIGNLYALSTAGSIIGTFVSGFYLIPYFGTNKLLIILAITLVILSLILFIKQLLTVKLITVAILVLGLTATNGFNVVAAGRDLIDVDTPYNRIWIYTYTDRDSGKPVRMMGINNENHSAMFLDSDELVNEYTKFYHLAKHFNPDFKKAVMFGGAGYSFPKEFLAKYPEATIDVVEIDPKITQLAKEHFRLKDDPRLTIYHEDGRVFLNKTKNKYDVIFGDAFGSRYSLPYQLTTREAVQKKYNILNDNGVVILNTISAIEGDAGKFLRAEYATYKSIFPQVYVFPVRAPDDGQEVQNIMLVALKSKLPPRPEYLKGVWQKEITVDVPILTDDYAPVDHYINSVI